MTYLALLLFGLLGSAHCVGMCGGISVATQVHPKGTRRALPLLGAPAWQIGALQNLGRLLMYALLGALAGSAGALLDGAWIAYGRFVLSILACAILLLGAASLLGVLPRHLSLERLGAKLWSRLGPRARSLLPLRTRRAALLFGAMWGLLPCGMVYSALALTATSADSLHGALGMLAFGLGTTPALLGLGLLGERLTRLARWHAVAGAMMLVLALVQISTLQLPRSQSSCCVHDTTEHP